MDGQKYSARKKRISGLVIWNIYIQRTLDEGAEHITIWELLILWVKQT